MIEGFHRTDEAGFCVSFTTFGDAEAVRKYLRVEQGVYGQFDADPVVLLLATDGHIAGNCRGTVAVFGDDERRAKTLARARGAIQAVLDGLSETGHHDWE